MPSPTQIVPKPPPWLSGLQNVRHVQGNIWEVDVTGYGRTVVGPYKELHNYLKKQGLGEDAHHIVGQEHLGDVKTGYTVDNAPAVALERRLHNEIVSARIGAEQKELGGRASKRSGRPRVGRRAIARLYRSIYRWHTRFRELSVISDHVLSVSHKWGPPPIGVPGGGGVRGITPPARALGGKDTRLRGTTARLRAPAVIKPTRLAGSLKAPLTPSPGARAGTIPLADLPTPNVRVRLSKVAFRFAAGLIVGVLMDIAVGLFVAYFEKQVNEENGNRIRDGWKWKVFPKIAGNLQDEMRMSSEGSQPVKHKVYLGVRWTLVMRELASDFSDVVVYAAKFAAGNPGFGEVYHDLEFDGGDLLRFETSGTPKTERSKRRRDPQHVDLVRYPILQWILVHDPKVSSIGEELRKTLRRQETLLQQIEQEYYRIDPTNRAEEHIAHIDRAIKDFAQRRAREALGAFHAWLVREIGFNTSPVIAVIEQLAESCRTTDLWIFNLIPRLDADERGLLNSMLGAKISFNRG